MKKRSLLVSTAVVMGMVFVMTLGYAVCSDAPETITMDSKVLGEHTKALVTFNHKKHNADYKVACTDCHHKYEGGKNVWKEGDPVEKCDACHKEAKPPAGDKSSKAEKIQKYYFTAIHENCVGCHKDMKKAGKPTGPTSCTDCHPKK
jgi:hypothetical protein